MRVRAIVTALSYLCFVLETALTVDHSGIVQLNRLKPNKEEKFWIVVGTRNEEQRVIIK